MKTHLLPCLTALSLAAISGLHAQTVEPPKPPAAELPPAPIRPPGQPKGESRLLKEVEIPAGPLSEIVRLLNQLVQKQGLPPLNVILSPDVQGAYAPEIVLRNVTGPDALRLIAAATGCETQSFVGEDGQIIGYRLHSLKAGPLNAARDHGHDHTAYGGGTPAYGTQLGELHPGAGAPAGALPPPSVDPVTPPGIAPGAPAGMPGAINVFGMGPAPNANSVRVYGLGNVTHTVKFNEIEATLRDTLLAGGIAADRAKIAFHEKTNVLVVNGEPRVHEFVSQLLDALQKNASAAEASEKDSIKAERAAIEAELRLEAEREQRARLAKQLDEAEARLRELQRAAAPRPH